jgi:hypothetical protein
MKSEQDTMDETRWLPRQQVSKSEGPVQYGAASSLD